MALLTVPIHQTTSLVIEPQVTEPIVIEEIKEEVKEDVKEVSSDVLCNCYKYSEVTSSIDLPPMATIQPNTDKPLVGAFAIMMYGEVKHIAIITEVTDAYIGIKEGNYKHCQETERQIKYDYKHLIGYYIPG